jgi:hypothetical protein
VTPVAAHRPSESVVATIAGTSLTPDDGLAIVTIAPAIALPSALRVTRPDSDAAPSDPMAMLQRVTRRGDCWCDPLSLLPRNQQTSSATTAAAPNPAATRTRRRTLVVYRSSPTGAPRNDGVPIARGAVTQNGCRPRLRRARRRSGATGLPERTRAFARIDRSKLRPADA